MTVGTHAYRVSSYRGSLRFHAVPSMRVDITRTGPDGAQERVVEAVAGPFGWNETEPGVNGSPAPDTAADRMLFLRTLPPGFLKGAGRPHDPVYSQDVNWNGDAIGSWDGDTLVVEVVGFNAESWLGWPGWFHSNNMHVIERLTREGSNLRYEVRVEDPDVLLEPWNMTPRTVRLNPNPKAFLMEDPPCVERDFSHMTSRERG